MSNEARLVYRKDGYCPICESDVEFTAKYDWYRDHLLCSGCGSIPRERALALVLERRFPGWRDLSIHESSPGLRGISPKLRRECEGYVETQYFPDEPLGKTIRGFRNENLEVQTFGDGTFDVVVTQDVLEHVNEPEDVFAEIARTLKKDGAFVFTVPTYKQRVESVRRARHHANGRTEHFADPEYHGNPISEAGSLVTFHYGYDLAELIGTWSDMDVEVVRFNDHRHGIIGEFTEVYIAAKRRGRSASNAADAGDTKGILDDRWPSEVQALCQDVALRFGVSPEVSANDATFRFLHDHPGFESKGKAVEYYFSDGANSAAKIGRRIDRWVNDSGTPLNILEFSAGHGAVTRHASKALAPHELHSCDMHPSASTFLADVLSVTSFQSAPTPEELELPARYDVIFALSFFARVPRASWSPWLHRLYAGLNPGGVLLFTTHGRTSMKYFPSATLDETGYWFVASDDQGESALGFGQSVTSREFVETRIAELPAAQYLDHETAGWWDHQDVYVVRKG